MAYDFPSSPVAEQLFTPPGGPTWKYVNGAWNILNPATGPGLPEAPIDGLQYARSDAAWEVVVGGGGSLGEAPNDGNLYARKSLAWDNITDDLAAKAPTVHTHAQVDITGLVAAQSAQDTAIAGKAPTVHTHPQADVTNLVGDLGLKAPLASPGLTGVPTAPTAAPATSTTQIATTAFVASAIPPAGIPEAPINGQQYARSNAAWAVVAGGAGGGREMLTAARTYYVRVDGNDANTGLTNNAAGAFLTPQAAWNNLAKNVDLQGQYPIIIHIAAGTYAGGIHVGNAPASVGQSSIIIEGDGATTIINAVSTSDPGAQLHVRNIKLTGGPCISATSGGAITLGAGIEFAGSGGVSIYASKGGFVDIYNSFSVTTNAIAVLNATGGGTIHLATGITITSSVVYSNAFISVGTGSTVIFADIPTFSGSPTGKRYEVSGGGRILSVVALTATSFAGTVAGTIDAGKGSMYGDFPVQASGGRERLTANRTYYVRTDGNDVNTGLTDDAAGAFLTVQKAWNTASQLDGVGMYGVNILVRAGTFASVVAANAPIGMVSVIIQGAGYASTSLINVDVRTPVKMTLGSMKLTGSAGVTANGAGVAITIGTNVMFACAATSVNAINGGSITFAGSITRFDAAVSPAAVITASQDGLVIVNGSQTFIMDGMASCMYFLQLSTAGTLLLVTPILTVQNGPPIGGRFNITGGGRVLSDAELTPTTFPGNTPGYVDSNGSMYGDFPVPAANPIFTGTVTCESNFQSSTAALYLGTTGAGEVCLRPNGVGSATNQLVVSSTGLGVFGNAAYARQGLALPTGTMRRLTYSTTTVTLPELAGHLMAVITDLKGMGFFS